MEWNSISASPRSPLHRPILFNYMSAWHGTDGARGGRGDAQIRNGISRPSPPSFAWGEVHIQLGWGPPPPPPACFPTSERLPEAHFKLKQTLLLREAKNHSILPPPPFLYSSSVRCQHVFQPRSGWMEALLFVPPASPGAFILFFPTTTVKE